MTCAKRGPADAHEAGISGSHEPWGAKRGQLMLMRLGFRGAMRGPADAHDAGISGAMGQALSS